MIIGWEKITIETLFFVQFLFFFLTKKFQLTVTFHWMSRVLFLFLFLFFFEVLRHTWIPPPCCPQSILSFKDPHTHFKNQHKPQKLSIPRPIHSHQKLTTHTYTSNQSFPKPHQKHLSSTKERAPQPAVLSRF